MTSPTPRPASDRDLVSPVDREIADALRDAGRSWGAVPQDVAARHLAAITDLAAEHVHRAARPSAPTWRSRIRRVAGLTVVKVAVAAGVAAATTGGMAAGGHLPDPVQGAVADGARWVGIDLPRPIPATAPDTAPRAPEHPPEAPGVAPEDLPEAPGVAPEDLPEDGPVEGPAPATSGSANVDRAEEGPPPGAGADDPAEPPAEPSPSANDDAAPDDPADLSADSPPSPNDDAGPPVEGPVDGQAPEVDGHDERLTRQPASGPQGHEADGAEARDTRP